MLRGSAIAVAMVVVPFVALAARPTTARLLSRADEQVAAAEFEAALITLQDAMRAPDNANEDLVRIYWRMGEVYVFLKRAPDAAEQFERLLYLDPVYDPPRLTSPRVRDAFTRTKSEFDAGGKRMSLEVPPSTAPPPGHSFDLPIVVRGLRAPFTARVFFRSALAEAWGSARLVPAADPERYTARLPAFQPGETVEFYAEIQGSDGRRVTGEGSALAPRTLVVGESLPAGALGSVEPQGPTTKPWYTRGWVWAAIGGAAVAVGVVTFVALQQDPAELHLRVTVTP